MLKQVRLLLLASFVSTYAHAKTFELDDYDENNDGKLSRQERVNLRNDLGPYGTEDRVASVFFALNKLERERGNPDQIPTEDVKAALFPDAVKCDLSQRVFLRDSLRNIAFLDCPENREKSGGASISYTEDFENGGSSGTLKGVLGYVLIEPGRVATPPAQRTMQDVLDDAALAVFAEVDGTLNSTQNHEGFARFGVEAEAWTRGIFDQTIWDLAGYYQPDLNFDTHAIGAELRVTPVHATAYLNSYLKPKDSNRKFFFQVNGILDAFAFPNAVNSSSIEDSGYVWLGGRLGAVYEDKVKALPNGFRLSAETLQFWDALHGETTNHYSAAAALFLNETQTTSLGVEFVSGRKHELPQSRQEQFMVKINFSY
ncbi:hypothetical protein [Roseibium marinum]|uniref:EF-hand domain-containing protein n=1 Tax=Roseibium marinum TaxID=281252 RepID=A0A2S3UJT2_9HYPH|nr:hypothetical protein [Roseibium marinum]POF27921.1 hypothetical protein CLV41_1192 [Roseibium marinum]